MSKEVLASISNTYELASYSTTELRNLFNDWLEEIERLIVTFVNKRNKVIPDEIAAHFKLKLSSVIFILSKLARKGKITMQATGNASSRIKLLRKNK